MSVATPESTADVVDLITDARLTGLPLWFTGSGTSPVPDGHTVVSTSKLMGIVDYKPDDLTVVVRCGTTLTELDAVLSEHGHTAVLPEAAGDRTVGGVVASGASGYRRLRYGPTRDRVIGATIVTGYGEIVHAGGQLVKNVTGYDLPRLMTGSRGALGFISDVSLKLWPIPKGRRTVSVANVADARVEAYQPIAALETEAGGFLHISDSACEDEGFSWPDPMTEEVVRVINIPPRLVPEAVARIKTSGATRFAPTPCWATNLVAPEALMRATASGTSRGGTLITRTTSPVIGSGQENPSSSPVESEMCRNPPASVSSAAIG